MTDYSSLQSLLTEYDVHQNRERGYTAAAVDAAYQAVSAECARLGVSVSKGRCLALGIPATRKIDVAGPAHVLTNGYEVLRFETADEARAANRGGQCWAHAVPAGEVRSFSVAA